MTLHFVDDYLTVHIGDCRAAMAEMEPGSVHCVVTSPPYWGLRDYGVLGQLGLETTPEAYVANMVAVFREVRRVLRDDGTVWLNLGDSYAAQRGGTTMPAETLAGGENGWMPDGSRVNRDRHSAIGLKHKDLIGIPWRVALALQQPYYTGRIKDERDRAWLAALVDGEGTFTILCTTSPHGSGNSYPPIAQVRMTSAGVVAKAASLVGVASPAQCPPSNRGNRAVYQWRLSGKRAADVARELYPYLIEKRKQALIVWNHQAVRDSYETKRGVTIPADALAKQHVCRDLIRRLNHGENVDIPSWMVEPPGMTEPGWYLRSDVIWAKPNPMPESVTDRPTKAHEYVFLLTKSARYFYDADAVREEATKTGTLAHLAGGNGERAGTREGLRGQEWVARKRLTARRQALTGSEVLGDPTDAEVAADAMGAGRNLRSVWTIATQPYPGAHFATFPEKLVEPCVKAGTSERGVCPECGASWVRVVERGPSHYAELGGDYRPMRDAAPTAFTGPTREHIGNTRTERGTVPSLHVARSETTGWRPSCAHDAEPVPAVVLDPFAGSGTTARVANRLGRRAILIDLSADYIDQAMLRNAQAPLRHFG